VLVPLLLLPVVNIERLIHEDPPLLLIAVDRGRRRARKGKGKEEKKAEEQEKRGNQLVKREAH